jgi:hypothetical protein
MDALLARRTIVVSGGLSSANEPGTPMRLAAAADENVERKRRRLCIDCTTYLLFLRSR